MHVCRTITDIRATAAGFHNARESVALVTTKGDLHAGQMALITRARAESQRVVVAILPETPHADIATDIAMLDLGCVDAVFAPAAAEFAPSDAETIVEPVALAKSLLGKVQPGYFRGPAAQAMRLFNLIQPEAACYGEKDYQQLCVLRQICRDLHVPVRVIGVPTQRDADGLALSSRNAQLSTEDRAAAPILSRVLTEAEEMAKTGITASRLRAWIAAHIQAEPRANLQSADIRDAQTLRTIAGPLSAPAVILLAVKFGRTLLIDQRIVSPDATTSLHDDPHCRDELPSSQKQAAPQPLATGAFDV